MAPLVNRPSVGRKPISQGPPQSLPQPRPPSMYQPPVAQQQVQQPGLYQQPGGPQQVWQQPGPQGQTYQQQQPMQPLVHQQQPIQQHTFQPGQQQQTMYQQPTQQQQVYQQQGVPQTTQPQTMQQRTAQQQPTYQQQVLQQPAQQYRQTAPQQSTMPYQQSVQQPMQQQQQQQQPIPLAQQPMQQHPGQMQQPQQQATQPQSVQQLQQLLQQRPGQQQPMQQFQQPSQQQPMLQQPVQQGPIQQQSQGQQLPTPSNIAPFAANRQSISSAASVRSIGSASSSHTNPPQIFGSPTSFPTSIAQHTAPSFITCSLCSTDISNDSTHLECLACTAAQIPTLFCTQCCVSKRAVPNHHHHRSNFVSVSDVVIFDPEVSAQGWELRKSALGISWYHHKGSKIKTFEKPKPPIPVTQPQVFRTDSSPLDGWEEIRDPDGRLFYYHRATKVSKWSRPQGNQLPAGWKECTNPDGRTYYLNTMSQATTWDRPGGSSTSGVDEQRSIISANSPNSVRSSTILETAEWSTDIEKSTVPAHRAASVPNSIIQTTNWSPSDPQHRPIPTRADTQPVLGDWEHGPRRPSRTFSKDSIASGSVAATKAVVNSTKSAVTATAKGVKVVGKSFQNSKSAQRIVMGVGLATVNAVLIDQFGVGIPSGIGSAAVGLVNAIDFDQTAAVVDVNNTNVTESNDDGNSMDVSGQDEAVSMPGTTGVPMDVNQVNILAGNDYVVGGSTEIVETTIVQENILIVPGHKTANQQPQQMSASTTYSGPHTNPGATRNAGPGPLSGPAEWEFSSMQRPATMIGSHIPIHVPNRAKAPMATAGVQTQRSVSHLGTVPHSHSQGPGNFPNVTPSYIPIHNMQQATPTQNQPQHYNPNPPQTLGQSQASLLPQGRSQSQTNPQQQAQSNLQHPPQQPANNSQPYHPARPQQAYAQNQQQNHSPQQAYISNLPQGPQTQGTYQQGNQTPSAAQPQFNQQQNLSQAQTPHFQNSVLPVMQNPNSSHQSGQSVTSNSPKPMLNPHQKAALMKAGMNIGTSLFKSAIRSSMSGTSGGNGDSYDDNDNNFDFGGSSNFDMRDSDFSNNGDDTFDSNNNFDDFTASPDQQNQNQDQDQFVDANQQFDDGSNSGNYSVGLVDHMNDSGDSNQYNDAQNNIADGASYDGMANQQGTDTANYDPTLSNQAGLDAVPDPIYDQQSDINQQAQGIFQASMTDDNAAMNGVFTVPDASFSDQSNTSLLGQGSLQTSMNDDNAAINSFFITPDASLNNQSDVNQLGQGIFQTPMADDNSAMNGFLTTPDASSGDQADINQTGQGVLQDSMDDDNAAMNGSLPTLDTTFSQSLGINSMSGTDSNTGAGGNLWTVNLPDTSSLSTTASQTFAGLTSASLSGPMSDFYDGSGIFDEGSTDQDPGQDEDQDCTASDDNTGILQDPAFSSSKLASSSSQDGDADSFTSAIPTIDQEPPFPDQFLSQSQTTTEDPTTQINSLNSTILNSNTNAAGSGGIAQTAPSISQLYDGSAYDDPDSAGSSPVDAQLTSLAGSGMALTTNIPQSPASTSSVPAVTTSPSMPTPDPMPDPALLFIGQ